MARSRLSALPQTLADTITVIDAGRLNHTGPRTKLTHASAHALMAI
ncbi:hypothetical protein NE857_17385 [Nocardiopsis exhalans]|uniref:Uncharacterized protein n=1 Tax=Nocardiopsis exhalans TaxID=163604 RepID=A0ABY5CZB3_9ACTN|nr:hypothetical protein [Nocardiopsis exhalans]USY17134.1 hypothetical protein NE857_17385 [Nocardiopsis exhalans]